MINDRKNDFIYIKWNFIRFIKIVGRIKDMIIRGGENVYPKEIEEFLNKMPGIDDV